MEVVLLNDWFEWNGVRCTEHGIHVLTQPEITVPAERVTFTEVPGRSGSLTTLQGEDVYDDMILPAECIVSDMSRIDEIAAYLKGGGTVTFANRQGGFYYARIVNQIPFAKIPRGNPHRSFTVNFRCKPFWYAAGVQDITLTASGAMVTNPGSVFSEPVITVHGSGDITLMVSMSIVELEGVGDSITLDSALQEAYSGTTLMNDIMSGGFPVLKPGTNAVSWSGDVMDVVITPRWRYL